MPADDAIITSKVFYPSDIPDSEIPLLPVRSLSYSKVAADGTVLVQHEVVINELTGTVDEYRFEREVMPARRPTKPIKHGGDVLTAIAFFAVMFGLVWGGFYLVIRGVNSLHRSPQSALVQENSDA